MTTTTTLFNPVIDVKHRPYCGPAAISALTGVPLSRAEAMIRRGRKNGYRDSRGRKQPIKGTYTWEVVKVLKRLGCTVTKLPNLNTTFGRFCEDMEHVGPCLVEVTGHFIATGKGMICDNGMAGPTPASEYRRKARRVRLAWRVEAPAEPKYGPVAEAPPRPTKPKPDIKTVRAARVAERIKAWLAKRRRADTALRKLRRQARYYGLELTSQ